LPVSSRLRQAAARLSFATGGRHDLESNNSLTLTSIASKVTFSTEQVARMCGVSRRQLAYWASKGIIPGNEGYSLGTIEKTLLLRRELERGKTLKGAVQAVERRLNERDRIGAMVADLSSQSGEDLCRAQLQKTEALLQQLRQRLSLVPEKDQQAILRQVAGLRLEWLLHHGAISVPQNELLFNLYKANEQLDYILSDLPKAI
jgi:DNA-binding transcriptional MerR regulator